MCARALETLSHLASAISRGLHLAWEATPGWTLLWALLLMLQGLVPALQIRVTSDVVNRLSGTGHHPWADPKLWIYVAGVGVLWLMGQGLSSLSSGVRIAQTELIQAHLHDLIHRKAVTLDMAFFDSPASLDRLHRARVDAIQQPLAMLESVGGLLQNGITLSLVALMLASYAAWLPALLILSALPGLWFVGRHVLREHRWRLETTLHTRRGRYLDMLLTDRASAAELRLLEAGPHHRSQFQAVLAHVRHGRLHLAWAGLKAEWTASLISFVGSAWGLAWMLLRAWRGQAMVGDLVLCYQAFQQGHRLMRNLLENAGHLYRSALFIENFFQFLATPTSIHEPSEAHPWPEGPGHEVRFDQLQFCYPDAPQPTLSAFSLCLPPGSVTALVGHNGAGKSTLIKLLCRFYDPTQGAISIDGVDLRAFSLEALRRHITVLFQEPVRYQASAAENIAMGDLASTPDARRIREAADEAGAHRCIERLPEGYASPLGTLFGGTELSVGEWQRVALARAFLRGADLLILDEPTSAMDPWSEAEWLRRFRRLAQGRTTLVITHRFTMATHADQVHVMEAGRIVESGSHTALLAAGGTYAKSWQAQMEALTHAPAH